MNDVRLPKLRGIDIEWLAGERQLQLVLGSAGDWEMFHVLCQDLIDSTVKLDTEEAALHTLITRLTRWQRLLSRGGPRIMDEHEIRGLIGELQFLRDELIPRFGVAAAASWLGPEGHPQDFAIGGVIVEVKTHMAGNLPSVMISSPDQLWSDQSTLFLHVTSLASDVSGAVSLPDLVHDLSRKLEVDSGLLEQFEGRLDRIGYVDLAEYRDHRYSVTSKADYRVTEGFPRLGPDVIPAGVISVKYAIRIDAIERFRAAIGRSTEIGDHK